MAYLLSRENEHELCSFCRYSGIIIRGPNRSENDHHLCRWDKRIRHNPSQDAAFFRKSEYTIAKPSHSHHQFPRSSLGKPGFLHRCFPVRCCLLTKVTKSPGKLACLQQVSNPSSQDNFQIYCADMYLERFLTNFAGFRVFLWILRDFADLVEIRGSAAARNIRSPVILRSDRQWRRWSWMGHFLIVMQAVYAVHSVVVAR